MRGMRTVLRCGLTKISQVFLTTLRITAWVSGAYMLPVPFLTKCSQTFTTWVRIGKTAPLREERHMKFANQSAGEYRDRLRTIIPAGISTMKHFGNLAVSER